MVVQSMPQLSPQAFAADVLPLLTDCWKRRCFCINPGFLKLLSFDFRDYSNTPAELLDSNMVWSEIIGKHFEPAREWSEVDGEPRRVFRCPQCGLEMLSRSQDYSINMWPTISRPVDERTVAVKGLYIVGIHYIQGFDPHKVGDFELAESTEQFTASVTGTP
jgi:hypothetical protein